MEQIIKILSVTGAVFLTLTLFFNINPRFFRIPFEPFIDRFGFRIYIPFFTSLIASVMIIMMMNFFRPPTS